MWSSIRTSNKNSITLTSIFWWVRSDLKLKRESSLHTHKKKKSFIFLPVRLLTHPHKSLKLEKKGFHVPQAEVKWTGLVSGWVTGWSNTNIQNILRLVPRCPICKISLAAILINILYSYIFWNTLAEGSDTLCMYSLNNDVQWCTMMHCSRYVSG